MPEIQIVFFQEAEGTVPVLDWILHLIPKAQVKCLARIKRLQQRGHQLRRPEADYLRDGIHELRIGLHGVNYRILYFFHGRTVAVLAHSLVKARRVPPRDIDLAVEQKIRFEQNPARYTYSGEIDDYGE